MTGWIISSSALIVIVALLRSALKGKMSLRLQYALWLLVLVRLLIPVSFFSSGLSVMNAVPETAAARIETIGAADVGAAAGGVFRLGQTARPVTDGVESARPVTVERLVSTVWLVGVAAVGCCLAASNICFYARLRRSRRKTDIRSPLEVYVTRQIATPCLFGVLRPAIYLTPDVLSGDNERLGHVLKHELAHYGHGDHIWSLLRCVCLALHWYNPLVWLAASLSMRDAELACDEAVIRILGDEHRADYGRTLIDLTVSGKRASALFCAATTMIGGRRGIRERVMLIAKRPKTAAVTLICVLIIAAVAVGCTFGSASSNGQKEPENGSTSSAVPETDTPQPDTAREQETAARYIAEYMRTGWWNGGTAPDCDYDTAAFMQLYREEKDGSVLLYGVARYRAYSLVEDTPEMTADFYTECIVTLSGETGEVADIWTPGDGAYHDMDIQERFPADIAEKLMNGSAAYADELAMACDENAKAHFGQAPMSEIPGTPQEQLADAVLSIDYASDALLADKDAYTEFLDGESDYMVKAVISASKNVTDLRIYSLRLTEETGELTFSTDEELYSQETLGPDKPLVLGLVFVGDLPEYAVFYTDAAGVERRYAILVSGEDGSLLLMDILAEGF